MCGSVWQDSATESGPYCKFAKIRGLKTSMTDDSMIRCIEPGSLWRLATRMVIFIDFNGIERSVVLGFIFYGFHRLYVIFGGFVWISWIPGGSGVRGLMTGSAGTAMDVLVTCFSKMGGGSGRRGCKNSAPAGVRCISGGDSENLFVSRFSFSPNVSKT